MAEPAEELDIPRPDVSHLVTEDDEPVENFFQDKQMAILTECLRVSWEEGRPFISGADVGVFYNINKPAVVPDVLLSTGVELPEDPHAKENRSYFIWNFGKPPDLVIEIVSNKKGGEDTNKLGLYAQIRIPYYVVYDPRQHLGSRSLRIFQLSGTSYVEKVDRLFPDLGLGLSLWQGKFDDWQDEWLRWTDLEGELLATGSEERERAEQERERAEQERERAERERLRVEQLEAKLRELGVDPNA